MHTCLGHLAFSHLPFMVAHSEGHAVWPPGQFYPHHLMLSWALVGFSLALFSFQSDEVSALSFLFCCNGGLGFAEQRPHRKQMKTSRLFSISERSPALLPSVNILNTSPFLMLCLFLLLLVSLLLPQIGEKFDLNLSTTKFKWYHYDNTGREMRRT